MNLLRRAIPTLFIVLVLVLVLPAAAATAATPHLGKYEGGEGISFHVGHSEHGAPVIDAAAYHGHTGFERALIHDGSFETCARVRTNSILFRDYCIHGSFGTTEHASGTVKVYQGAHGHRPAGPIETHHWSATLR